MTPATQRIRKTILEASHFSGHGHIPTSFSVVEMLHAVYSVMRHRPEQPDWNERDLFILSKGHAALGHYAVLAEWGYVAREELKTFGSFGARFGCHPDRHKVPGVEASTGSLGHGIGLAVGMALGQKIHEGSRRVYALIGDGESNEGSVWESSMVAVDQKLDNLTLLYDDNRSQTRCLQITQPGRCFAAFGFEVQEVDGHNLDDLQAALKREGPPGQPRVLICRTVKGYGCPTMSNDVFAWHRRAPKADELSLLLQELESYAQTV